MSGETHPLSSHQWILLTLQATAITAHRQGYDETWCFCSAHSPCYTLHGLLTFLLSSCIVSYTQLPCAQGREQRLNAEYFTQGCDSSTLVYLNSRPEGKRSSAEHSQLLLVLRTRVQPRTGQVGLQGPIPNLGTLEECCTELPNPRFAILTSPRLIDIRRPEGCPQTYRLRSRTGCTNNWNFADELRNVRGGRNTLQAAWCSLPCTERGSEVALQFEILHHVSVFNQSSSAKSYRLKQTRPKLRPHPAFVKSEAK